MTRLTARERRQLEQERAEIARCWRLHLAVRRQYPQAVALFLRAGGGALAIEQEATVCAGMLGRATVTCPLRWGEASAFDSVPRLLVAADELPELRAALLALGRQVCEVAAEAVAHD